MSIVYEWQIESIYVMPEIDDKNDVIKKVKYVYDGSRGKENHFVIGEVELDSSNLTEKFVDYDDVTKELLIQWIENTLGEEVIDSYKQQIESRFTPEEFVAKPLPWYVEEIEEEIDEEIDEESEE